MTWSERIKLAWRTFKREALPLYAWTLIFIGVGVVLIVAMVMGILGQWHWTLPQAYGEFSSPGMPVPGIPPKQGITPFTGQFGSLADISSLLSSIGTIAGSLILLAIFAWLIGSAFYTGVFNLTAKSYYEKATFKDFRMTGFFRVLGWQVFLLIIELILLIIGLIGAFTIRSSPGALIAFFIIYGLVITGIMIFTLPWLSSSAIYLLAHPEDSFRTALGGSWRFFRRHMGALWGYIGTFFLIEIAFQILNRISPGLAGLATFVVSPFVAVLAIVWVLSLEEDERNNASGPMNADTPPPYSTASYLEAQTITPPTYDDSSSTPPQTPRSSLPKAPVSSESEKPKIDLQKQKEEDDNPNFCPSCGRANTGTAYCPQCGTKL
jgi:Predicted membrane protein